jgi:hypothetical protein
MKSQNKKKDDTLELCFDLIIKSINYATNLFKKQDFLIKKIKSNVIKFGKED